MSDKKFNFLNNLIECTITTVILPTGKGANHECQCFNGKPIRSFKQVTIANSGQCLFYALELAREYSDSHKVPAITKTRADTLRHNFTRIYKNHEKRLKTGVEWLMKAALETNEPNLADGGCNIALLEKVGIKFIINKYCMLTFYLLKIQKCYDMMYNGIYRIVIMDNLQHVIYKARINYR